MMVDPVINGEVKNRKSHVTLDLSSVERDGENGTLLPSNGTDRQPNDTTADLKGEKIAVEPEKE